MESTIQHYTFTQRSKDALVILANFYSVTKIIVTQMFTILVSELLFTLGHHYHRIRFETTVIFMRKA